MKYLCEKWHICVIYWSVYLSVLPAGFIINLGIANLKANWPKYSTLVLFLLINNDFCVLFFLKSDTLYFDEICSFTTYIEVLTY